MSRDKQIEEMMRNICESDICSSECRAHCRFGANSYCWDVEILAEKLYAKGYRKQSEGEWIKDQESKFQHRYHCSVCNFYLIGEPTKHCEDCGAKMKGGAE